MHKVICGLDYDGVIADTNKIKSALIKKLWGINVPSFLTDKTSITRNKVLNERQYESLIGITMGRKHSLLAPEVSGVKEGLKALSRKGRVYIITVRTLSRSEYAKEWLKKHGILNFIAGIYCTDEDRLTSKKELCEELGINILVDDDEGQLEKIKSKAIRRILFKDGAVNKPKLEAEVGYARNWKEVLDLLEK